MDYQPIDGGHQWRLENGAVVEILGLHWSSDRLNCTARVLTNDGSILGSSHLELSNTQARYRFAQELAGHNGATPVGYADTLLAIWDALATQHRANAAALALQLTPMADVAPRDVDWLWPGRIPKGKIALFAGDPGLGKSWMLLDIAARISHGGPWPDGGTAPRGNVLIISGEDGLADTIRPRLDTLGADLTRIFAISTVLQQDDHEVAFSIAEHLAQLEMAITKYQAELLILDPLLGFLGKGTDTHRSSDVRTILLPLAAMSERTECAISAILHLNKRSGEANSLYRLTASLDFAAAARSVMVVGKDPDDTNKRILASVKSNLSAAPESLSYHITEDGTFAWGGVVNLDANAILAAPQDKSAREDAKEFIADFLANGETPAKEVLAAASAHGIAEKTLRRAAKDLGVDVAQVGTKGKSGTGGWIWRLAPDGLS